MTFREPCPICDHPTGDCRGHETEPVKVVGANIFPSLGHEDVYVVMEDVFEERSILPVQEYNPNGITKQVRIFRKGQVIPISEAKRHNLPQA